MLLEILKFEIKYRFNRADTYIYFAVLFLFSLIAVDFLFEGKLQPIKENSPYVILFSMTVLSAIFMMITSMIMGVAALRDFDHKMESLMFVNPIKKSDYLLGRFFGSFAVLLFIFSGLFLGMILSRFLPWKEAENFLQFSFLNYAQPFLLVLLPTLFFGAALFFVSGALSRKLIVVYTQGILLFVVYILVINLAQDSENQTLAALLDPFSFQTIKILMKNWTPMERNSILLPFEGILLYNKIIWIGVGIISLIVGYYGFNFNVVRNNIFGKTSKSTRDNTLQLSDQSHIKIPKYTFPENVQSAITQIIQHAIFNFKTIFREVPFWAILICGIAIIFINSINLDTTYGVDSLPTTYIILGELIENSILFFLLIIIFYSGELIWKERDSKINFIYDALPITGFKSMTGKFLGLIMIYSVLILALIFSGVLFQAMSGYYKFELGLYFAQLFGEVFPFLILLTVAAFFFQALVNHKFLAHILLLIFVFVNVILLKALGLDHGLYTFGGTGLGTYSDMNGFGHFIEPYFWFKIYWIAFSVLLFIATVVLSVRGTETRIKKRWKLIKQNFSMPLARLAVGAFTIFIFSGCYIYYNTNVLNDYALPKTEHEYQANYEKTLKKYEFLPQPKIVDVNLKIDLFPLERNYVAEGNFTLFNPHEKSIKEVHIQKPPSDKVKLNELRFENGAVVNDTFAHYSYYIYRLEEPIAPGDSLEMFFKQTFTTIGFQENSSTQIVYNGTFINNFQFPTISYNDNIELISDNLREENGLAPRVRRAKIDDPDEIKIGMAGGDGEEINFEIIISTDIDQTAIAPGYLQKEWVEKESRRYFHYKMDKPMTNFYSIVSARYETLKDQWYPIKDSGENKVNLEVFYQEGHEYNLNRMMEGMKKSLDYYSQSFGPYQYQQMRIMEFPSYKKRAQSFPNTVPFSESIGFILDIDDAKDVDMVFYVTAHEVAHQWWGHQVNPANVQGKSMLSETLAQYSTVMVMKKNFSEDKTIQILKLNRESYLEGRSNEKTQEMPLALVESGQQYIYYRKGLVNMYALQDYISEDSVNIALKRFVRDWDSFSGLKKKKVSRYATTQDLMEYFRDVTPDSLQYVIHDLFETVTLYDNKISEASFEQTENQQYKVNLKLNSIKYQVDSLGVENQIKTNDWIDIGLYSKDKNGKNKLIYLKKHQINQEKQEIEILVNQKPTKAGIDPLHILIDKNEENNIFDLK